MKKMSLKALNNDPYFSPIIKRYRTKGKHIKSSNYDISERCNLKCEGCLYYEGERPILSDEQNLSEWANLFLKEKERGINLPILTGAEAALELDILYEAAKVWKQGVIYANGSVPIPTDLPFKIHISCWSLDDDEDVRLRGAKAFKRALKIFKGDPRVCFNYTIHKENIGDIEKVLSTFEQEGFKVVFNFYSPTRQYNEKLRSLPFVNPNDLITDTFRISDNEANLLLDESDFEAIYKRLVDLMPRYKDVLLGTLDYYRWITSKTIYNIDERGKALDCGVLNSKDHLHIKSDLSVDPSECCCPNIDCKSCRLYAPAFMSYLSKTNMLRETETAKQWLNMFDIWGEMHIPNWNQD